MLDNEDLKWLAANATELNRLLQTASRQVDQARRRNASEPLLESLSDQVERAARSSQSIFDRVTARILAGAGNGTPHAPAVENRRETYAKSGPGISTRMPVGEVTIAEESGNAPVILNPKGARELILLVDDDKSLLECTGDILDFEDYRFITANDGLEALHIYRHFGKQIDLILLDYFLPVMDGDAVFDELKAIDPSVRVVLSSGFGELAKVGSMLGRGLCGFIPKPYTHEKLIEQIRSVLDA